MAFPVRSRSSLCLAALGLLAQSFVVSRAEAVSFRVVAGGGYETLQGEKREGADAQEPEPFKGYALQALGEVGFLDSVPGFSLLAGGGLRYAGLSAEQSGLKVETSVVMAAGEFGAEFSALPLLRLQGLVGYDYGLSGEVKFSGKVGSVEIDSSNDLDYFNRFQVSARALFTVAPFLSLGVEPAYFTGKFRLKPEGDEEMKQQKFSGYAVKAVAAFTL